MRTHTQSVIRSLALPLIFTTIFALVVSYSAQAANLPDVRVYEMVTPPENYDANVYIPSAHAYQSFPGEGIYTKRPFQASTNGNAVVYVADPIHGGARSGLSFGDNYMATRNPDGGWAQTNLQPFGFSDAAYQAFSNDLSVGVLTSGSGELPEFPALPGTEAPGEGYDVLYTRTASGGDYHPFFTQRPPNRSPVEFEAYGVPQVSNQPGELAFAGASEDFSRLFFEANDALVPGAVNSGSEENNLYESVNGQLNLVNILPDGSSKANATFGGMLGGLERKALPGHEPDFSHAISSNGSLAFWTDLNTDDLYVSEGAGTPGEKTLQIDVSDVGGLGGGGQFWTASSDGSKVFFTDSETADLTSNTVPGSGVNLYEYEVGPAVGQPGALKDLTPVSDAGVEGVVGASENGEYIYFVATGTLSSNENTDHQVATSGADNLYVLHDNESPVFIGSLSPEDYDEAQPFRPGEGLYFGDWQPGLGVRTAEVTPDGKSLVFMSKASLTGYPNEGIEEVYVYDEDDSRLSCVSCNSDGTPPEPPDPEGVGGFLPISWSNTRQSQWISDNGGRVFFDSEEPLVPQDTNDRQDVYEWEREGEGSCTQPNGCVYLLSGGVSESASWLEGMSANGSDVFIDTRAKLRPEDQNENFDLYDARVDGVEPVLPPSCTGTGCQGLPAPPPTFATPPSVTFEGVGNFPPPGPMPAVKTKAKTLTRAEKLVKALKACRAKHNKAKRVACEAQARKRYGSSVKAGKSGVDSASGSKR